MSCPWHAVDYRHHSVPYLHVLGFTHFIAHYMLQSTRMAVCITCFSQLTSSQQIILRFSSRNGSKLEADSTYLEVRKNQVVNFHSRRICKFNINASIHKILFCSFSPLTFYCNRQSDTLLTPADGLWPTVCIKRIRRSTGCIYNPLC